MRKFLTATLIFGVAVVSLAAILQLFAASLIEDALLLRYIVKQTAPTMYLFGGLTAFCSLLGLILAGALGYRCQVGTTACALGVSASTTLGLHCVLSFISCYFLTTPTKHPIRYPTSVALGIICLCAFALCIYFYIVKRKNNRSIVGILLDIGLCIAYLPAFTLVWAVADNVASRLVDIWF